MWSIVQRGLFNCFCMYNRVNWVNLVCKQYLYALIMVHFCKKPKIIHTLEFYLKFSVGTLLYRKSFISRHTGRRHYLRHHFSIGAFFLSLKCSYLLICQKHQRSSFWHNVLWIVTSSTPLLDVTPLCSSVTTLSCKRLSKGFSSDPTFLECFLFYIFTLSQEVKVFV